MVVGLPLWEFGLLPKHTHKTRYMRMTTTHNIDRTIMIVNIVSVMGLNCQYCVCNGFKLGFKSLGQNYLCHYGLFKLKLICTKYRFKPRKYLSPITWYYILTIYLFFWNFKSYGVLLNYYVIYWFKFSKRI